MKKVGTILVAVGVVSVVYALSRARFNVGMAFAGGDNVAMIFSWLGIVIGGVGGLILVAMSDKKA